MDAGTWASTGYMFITETDGETERYRAISGTLAELYDMWIALPENERITANIRLKDRTLFEADDIAAFTEREDFPSKGP